MRLNNFSIRVIGGNEDSAGYVNMKHGQVYQIQLRNDNNRRCDARVEIDGHYVNTWRVEAHSSITVNQKSNDVDGLFTFYKIGSAESRHG